MEGRDSAQHASVEGGDALRILEQSGKVQYAVPRDPGWPAKRT